MLTSTIAKQSPPAIHSKRARLSKTIAVVGTSIFLAAATSRADAQTSAPLLTLEASAGTALGAPHAGRFAPGAAGAVAGYYPLVPWLLAGAKLRAGFLSNVDARADRGQVDPGVGTFQTLTAMLRVRPLASSEQPLNALGLFVEAGPSGVLTGDLLRAGVEAGIGWGFDMGSFAVAPALRYLQVMQPSDPLSDEDARVLLLGADFALLGSRPMLVASKSLPPSHKDVDVDGLFDNQDACPDLGEDRDGHRDDDGCPESDDDGDELEDESDRCPSDPEDFDAFEDEDGCPEPDNDRDGFADIHDQCPDEPEVVNGSTDYDGCPDEGLIEMRDDRITLEEQVLFDFERARVRSAARDILAAIVNLYQQHPEWMRIRIEGHADSRGNEAFNRELSERRAQNVRKQLIKLGIPAELIESEGHGSTRPRDNREQESAHHRNRRVEFVVVARTIRPADPTTFSAPMITEKTDRGGAK